MSGQLGSNESYLMLVDIVLVLGKNLCRRLARIKRWGDRRWWCRAVAFAAGCAGAGSGIDRLLLLPGDDKSHICEGGSGRKKSGGRLFALCLNDGGGAGGGESTPPSWCLILKS